jgi:hypothetical protein
MRFLQFKYAFSDQLYMTRPVLQLFAWHLEYKEATTICDSLGGQLPLPKDQVNYYQLVLILVGKEFDFLT